MNLVSFKTFIFPFWFWVNNCRSLRTETPIKSLGTIIGISTCRLVPNFQPCQFGRLWVWWLHLFLCPGTSCRVLAKKKEGIFYSLRRTFSTIFKHVESKSFSHRWDYENEISYSAKERDRERERERDLEPIRAAWPISCVKLTLRPLHLLWNGEDPNPVLIFDTKFNY